MDDEKRKRLCHERIWIWWIRLCRKINDFIELIFERHTRFITKHYRLVIGICFLVVGVAAIGAVWFKNLGRNEELFIPQNSQAFKDLDEVEKHFSLKRRFQEVIISSTSGTNILNSKLVMIKALELHKKIINISSFDEYCIRTTKYDSLNSTCHTNVTSPINKALDTQGECLFASVLDLFDYNMTLLSSLNVSQIQATVNSSFHNDFLLFRNGRNGKLNLGNVLGKFNAITVSASAIRIIYYLKYATTTEDSYDKILSWEKKFINLCEQQETLFKKIGLELDYSAQRTRDDAVLHSTVGDLPFFSVAFILMVMFCLAVFFNFQNPVTGHLTLGISGIFVIMLGVGTGFGMSMWLQTDFVAFTGILMFLILGIGMDNMFIIVDAVESVDPEINGPERLIIAMKHVGGSITMTTTTDLVAFAVSTVSDFPAVHLFCIYASLSIFFAYVMLITLFLALTTADIHRVEKRKRDVFPCCTAKNFDPEVNPWHSSGRKISKIILNKWGHILMKTPTKVIVMGCACGLLAAGVYGTTEISQSFDWKKLGRDDSYFVKYANSVEDHFKAGYGVSIVLRSGIDYSNDRIQADIKALDGIAKANSRFESNTINFMTAFLGWANSLGITNTTGENFYCHFKKFLLSFQTFREDITFNKRNEIDVSRVIFFYENDRDAINQARAMQTIRGDLKSKSNISSSIFPISILFIYAEQFAAILDATVVNLAICAATVLVITLPYLIHPGITCLVFLSFVSLLFELFGLMAAWDTSLDVIAMIVIIMAIGFSVDYTCHVAHAYMISREETPELRAIDALTTMGSSVLNGGFSTFLGMLVTGFSNAEGFRIFFRMMFGIVALGLLHGLAFLPVLLSIFVRHDLREDMQEFADQNESTSAISLKNGYHGNKVFHAQNKNEQEDNKKNNNEVNKNEERNNNVIESNGDEVVMLDRAHSNNPNH